MKSRNVLPSVLLIAAFPIRNMLKRKNNYWQKRKSFIFKSEKSELHFQALVRNDEGFLFNFKLELFDFILNHQPYASLQLREFRIYLLARLFLTAGWQMQGVIVGWQVYELTKDAFALGLVGLSEAAPFILTCPFGGHTADTTNK